VALPAILSKLILVRILVAAGAISEWHTPEFLEGLSIYDLFPVALQAINGFVLPCKLKPRTGVIEF